MQVIIGTYKIRKDGARGYTIALPNSFVRDNKLKVSDTMLLITDTEKDNELVITKKPKKNK